MDKNNTGLALSEVRGPLNNLFDNLSGEHGEYWLTALKKLLRKEEIPEPPIKVLQAISKQNLHREKMREKVKVITKYIEKIPVVDEVHIIQQEDQDNDLITISVYASIATFFHNMEDCDTASFHLRTDGTMLVGNIESLREVDIDPIYQKWCEQFNVKGTMTLKDLCTALIELGKMYEKTVLDIEI